jgi:hypothetical protein
MKQWELSAVEAAARKDRKFVRLWIEFVPRPDMSKCQVYLQVGSFHSSYPGRRSDRTLRQERRNYKDSRKLRTSYPVLLVSADVTRTTAPTQKKVGIEKGWIAVAVSRGMRALASLS